MYWRLLLPFDRCSLISSRLFLDRQSSLSFGDPRSSTHPATQC
jgi:hypothetical protein